MAVIDFHSHILPGIDDGSSSVEKSLQMYSLCVAQGTDIIIVTPHFYASHDRVESFLEKRAYAYQSICKEIKDRKTEIRLGAEVAYFSGISQAEKVSYLTIEGTRTLLLEMPFDIWNDSVLKEVEKLITERGLIVLLAHLERYWKVPGNRKWVQRILELPIYTQINAGTLLDWRQKRKVLRMFRKNQAHFLGSDCHGISHRPPNLFRGREILMKEFGKEFIDQMDTAGMKLLEG